jgi:hypothetical protein
MFRAFGRRVAGMVWGACLVIACLAPVAASADINSAFQNLLGSSTNVSVNAPGNYQSEARDTFIAGGADVRFPSRSFPTLYSVTPFEFHSGCGGISVFFGGFSFISGDQIKQLIQSVAQNSVGVAIELVMTTLCGPCAHVMQVMRALAKDAAKTAIDSCQMARSLVEHSGLTELLGADPQHPDKAQAWCASGGTANNDSSDWIAAISNDVCSSADKVTSEIQNFVQNGLKAAGISGSSSQGQMTLCASGAQCNTLWTVLNQTNLRGTDTDNIRAKLVILNVIGTNVLCGTDPDCLQAASAGATDAGVLSVKNGVVWYPPRLGNVQGGTGGVNMQDVFTLYMCGTNYATASPNNASIQAVLNSYCSIPANSGGGGLQSISDAWVWDCATGSGSNRYDQCLSLSKVQVRDSGMAGSGYLAYVANLMQQGVDAVRNNQPMPSQVIQLIQLMPVPLYEAINAAAVYPEAGSQLVAVMSTYAAQLLTYADLRDTIREAERLDQNVKFSAQDMERVYAFLGGMRASADKAELQIASSITMQQTLMQQIRQINVAMQKEVLSEDLLGPARFSTAVAAAAQGGAQ